MINMILNGRKVEVEKYEGGGSLSISRIDDSLGRKLTREFAGDSLDRSSPLYMDVCLKFQLINLSSQYVWKEIRENGTYH